MLEINMMKRGSSGAGLFPGRSATRLVVVDDNKVFRDALRSFLERQPGFRVVAEAENGLMGVEKVQEHQPDVVLMDVSMPVLNGIDATRMITSRFPAIKVIVLSVHDNDAGFSQKAYEAGAFYYFSKTADRNTILAAIQRARPSH